MRRIPPVQQPRAIMLSRTERQTREEYSDDDYDDEDEDDVPESFDHARDGRYPIQAAGGNLPPSVVAALQNLRLHGGPAAGAATEMDAPAFGNFDDDVRRGAHHEAALQFLLYQQQQLHQPAASSVAGGGVRGGRVPLVAPLLSGAPPLLPQEYYTEEEHLNRTPSGSSSGEDDARDGRRGGGGGSSRARANETRSDGDTAALAYHQRHLRQFNEADDNIDDDDIDDEVPETRHGGSGALVAMDTAAGGSSGDGVDEDPHAFAEQGDAAGAELTIQDADGQLVEGFSEDYEPTEQEILEYCEWLGMDVKLEKALMWIAREALKAPLPENWKMCYTEEREVYYFNVRTGESIWDHPMDAYFKCLYKEERAKLEVKRRRVRQFSESLPVKPLAEFFGDLSDTCGVGGILLDDEDEDDEDERCGGEGGGRDGCRVKEQQQQKQQKKVPAWKDIPESLIDPIDFRVFLDPVVLPTSGRTVSRHTIINNLWRDPFSREYCENRRLVPNVDKRTEVDRWLQQMVHAYIQDMRVGTKAGVRRLATILPYLLDRDEEATLRAQTLVLSWLNQHIETDRLSARGEEDDQVDAKEPMPTTSEEGLALPPTALPATGRQCQTQASNKSSPSTTPRDGAGHTKRTSVNKHSHSGAKSSNSRSSGEAGGGGGAFTKKIHSAVHLARTSSTIPPSRDCATAVGPPAPVATSSALASHRRSPKRLPTILQELGSDLVDSLVLSLLSMSTSASREALLQLTGHVPFVLESSAFRRFPEEILYALRASRKDIWEIVTAAATAEAKEVLEAPPVEASDAVAPTQHRRSDAGAKDYNTASQQDAVTTGTTGAPEGHPLSSSTTKALKQLLSCHNSSDSERHLALQWIDRLAQYSHACEQHPLVALDFMSAVHLTLCTAAQMLFLAGRDAAGGPAARRDTGIGGVRDATSGTPKTAAAAASPLWSSAPLLRLLMRVNGWPAKISSISDKHLSALMEISLHAAVDDPRTMVSALFDLTLHGSERCLDVLRRHAAVVRQCVVLVLSTAASSTSDGCASANASQPSSRSSSRDRSRPALYDVGSVDASNTAAPSGVLSTSSSLRRSTSSLSKSASAGGLSSFSSADLMAAVLIFHELATLSEFSEVLPPRVALRIGYNLTPRLARSQWRPKHFHGTVSKMVELVEAHPATAWGVIDRAGLTFFLRELSKKKGLSGDVRSKIEGVEYSDKQLEHSATVTRWGLFALRLLTNRGAEVAGVIAAKQQQRNARRAQPPLQQQPPHQTARTVNGLSKTPRATTTGATAQPPPSKQPLQPVPQPAQQQGQICHLGYFRENRHGAVAGSLCGTGAMRSDAASASQTHGLGSATVLASPCSVPVTQQLALVSAKFDDLTRQRASLLSQALMLLITVRLKPRQQPQRGGAGQGTQSTTTAETPVKGATSTASAFSSSGSNAKLRASPSHTHVQPVSQQNSSSVSSPRHGTTVTAYAPTTTGGNGEYSAPPPTSSLPSLRAPRGGGQSMVLAEPSGDVTLPHHSGSGTGFLPPI